MSNKKGNKTLGRVQGNKNKQSHIYFYNPLTVIRDNKF